MQPPLPCPAGRPVAVFLEIFDEQTDDRPTTLDGCVECGVVRQPQVLSKPDDCGFQDDVYLMALAVFLLVNFRQ